MSLEMIKTYYLLMNYGNIYKGQSETKIKIPGHLLMDRVEGQKAGARPTVLIFSRTETAINYRGHSKWHLRIITRKRHTTWNHKGEIKMRWENLLAEKCNKQHKRKSESMMMIKYIIDKRLSLKPINKCNKCEGTNIKLNKTMKSTCL